MTTEQDEHRRSMLKSSPSPVATRSIRDKRTDDGESTSYHTVQTSRASSPSSSPSSAARYPRASGMSVSNLLSESSPAVGSHSKDLATKQSTVTDVRNGSTKRSPSSPTSHHPTHETQGSTLNVQHPHQHQRANTPSSGAADISTGEGVTAYQYAAVQQITENRENVEYILTVREQPKHSRMCGVGEKADRRPIDPAPIIQLRVVTHDHPSPSKTTPPEPSAQSQHERRAGTIPLQDARSAVVNALPASSTSGAHQPGKRNILRRGVPVRTEWGDGWEDKTWYLENPYYFMYAMLADADTDEELHLLGDRKTRYTTGSCVSCLYHLKDIDGSEQGFFVFPDLSIRVEGRYRLKLCLFETIGHEVHHCKSIYSKPFNVYTAKRFPGMEESTPLSKSFADQGLKVRVRKNPRARRVRATPGGGKRKGDSAGSDDDSDEGGSLEAVPSNENLGGYGAAMMNNKRVRGDGFAHSTYSSAPPPPPPWQHHHLGGPPHGTSAAASRPQHDGYSTYGQMARQGPANAAYPSRRISVELEGHRHPPLPPTQQQQHPMHPSASHFPPHPNHASMMSNGPPPPPPLGGADRYRTGAYIESNRPPMIDSRQRSPMASRQSQPYNGHGGGGAYYDDAHRRIEYGGDASLASQREMEYEQYERERERVGMRGGAINGVRGPPPSRMPQSTSYAPSTTHQQQAMPPHSHYGRSSPPRDRSVSDPYRGHHHQQPQQQQGIGVMRGQAPYTSDGPILHAEDRRRLPPLHVALSPEMPSRPPPSHHSSSTGGSPNTGLRPAAAAGGGNSPAGMQGYYPYGGRVGSVRPPHAPPPTSSGGGGASDMSYNEEQQAYYRAQGGRPNERTQFPPSSGGGGGGMNYAGRGMYERGAR